MSIDTKMILEELQGMNKRFDGMDARFDGIDARFDGMDARFDGMDARFERLEGEVANVKESVHITNLIIENEVNRDIKILLESHQDLRAKINELCERADKHDNMATDVMWLKNKTRKLLATHNM